MATEFQEVMRQWARMCNSVPGKDECLNLCSDKESGYVCPMKYCGLCNKSVSNQTDADRLTGERIIMSWAAEHPEPVYPTWWKYMCMIGVIPNTLGDKTLGEVTVERLMHISIPADIAEKLGLKPKKQEAR